MYGLSLCFELTECGNRNAMQNVVRITLASFCFDCPCGRSANSNTIADSATTSSGMSGLDDAKN